jgi:hypothetical protein
MKGRRGRSGVWHWQKRRRGLWAGGSKFEGCRGEMRIEVVMLLLLVSLLPPAPEDGLVRFAQEDDGES